MAGYPNNNENKSHIKGNSSNKTLVALLIVAFVFSSTTIFFISPKIVTLERMDMGGHSIKNPINEDESKENKDTIMQSPLPSTPRISKSDLITWMLSGHDKDAHNRHSALSTLINSPSATQLEFQPGSLHMSHSQALQHCYADPKVYQNHVQGGRSSGNVRVTYSDKHKLAYVMLPKSGSSTARFTLKTDFHAKEGIKSLQHTSFKRGGSMDNWQVATFVRDPLSRFYSQYDEAFVRTAPWQKNGNEFYIDPDTKKQRTPHPFSYIHNDIHSYKEYEEVFCPVSKTKNRKDCTFQKSSQENGTLTSRFERFVSEYNGRDPFDIHLTLQVPMLSSESGLPLHITQIYNTTDSEKGWNTLAKQFLGETIFFT